MLDRLVRHFDPHLPKAALLIAQRPPLQRAEIRRRERFELEHLRARDERRVDVEERIVRRRADQPHRAALHIGQQYILLRLVPAVNFVDEQNRLVAFVGQTIRRRRDDAAQIRHVALHAAQPLKARGRRQRDDLRERRLPRARRAEENDRRNAIRLDRPAQQLARREQMLLPRVFIERARPHPLRERRGGRGLGRGFGGEEIRHDADPPPCRKAGARRNRAAPGTRWRRHGVS